jgi:hypothetical protein
VSLWGLLQVALGKNGPCVKNIWRLSFSLHAKKLSAQFT